MALSDSVINASVGAAIGLIDQLYTTEEERDAAKLKVLQLAAQGQLAQMDVNKAEAASGSIFVGGWRPAVGWTCVLAFAINYVFLPLISSVVVYYTAFTGEYVDLSAMPEFNMSELMPVLLGMLGLGSLRTYEKYKGVAK